MTPHAAPVNSHQLMPKAMRNPRSSDAIENLGGNMAGHPRPVKMQMGKPTTAARMSEYLSELGTSAARTVRICVATSRLIIKPENSNRTRTRPGSVLNMKSGWARPKEMALEKRPGVANRKAKLAAIRPPATAAISTRRTVGKGRGLPRVKSHRASHKRLGTAKHK